MVTTIKVGDKLAYKKGGKIYGKVICIEGRDITLLRVCDSGEFLRFKISLTLLKFYTLARDRLTIQ